MNGGQSLVSPKKVTLILVLVVLCLTILGIVSSFVMHSQCRLLLVEENLKTRRTLMREPFVKLFGLNREANVPTFYSTFALLLSSAFLAIIAFAKKKENAPYRLHWKVLSVIFLFLSLDEAAHLHEMTIKPLRSALNASGFLLYTWVILGIVFSLIVLLAYLRFLADLPRKSRNLFLVAGALFVGGALGMEMISGYYDSSYVTQPWTHSRFCDFHLNLASLRTVEELLEMLGIVVFIYALMSYISLHVKDWLTLIE